MDQLYQGCINSKEKLKNSITLINQEVKPWRSLRYLEYVNISTLGWSLGLQEEETKT